MAFGRANTRLSYAPPLRTPSRPHKHNSCGVYIKGYMDQRAPPATSLCLFKETRVDFEPSNLASVIRIQLTTSSNTFSRGRRPQRSVVRSAPAFKDEKSFTEGCLASSSSIHFGKIEKHPRSFLWRLLENGKVLELRSVDLSKSDRVDEEATLIIQLVFSSAIRPGGVDLADTDDQDSLNVFALTKTNELYTFTLPTDFFCHANASEVDHARWCKVFRPSSFSISTPHRLVAGSSLQLLVALSDGRLLRLTRKKEDDGSQWHETNYNDGQWGSSLRGLIRWQGSNTVRYHGEVLDQNTAIAMALSPDRRHAFIVCLNHTMKIWNLDGTKNVVCMDLLGQQREPQEQSKMMLDPGTSRVLHVFQPESLLVGDEYYAVTFSPNDLGQFKIWAIRDADEADRGIRDLFPEAILRPPDPDPSPDSKAIWKVMDFMVKGVREGEGVDIWILMRSNKRYKLYNNKFGLQDVASSLWHDRWSVTASETLGQHPQPQISDHDPEDAMELWLEFLFYPGKYPQTILETALSIYSPPLKPNVPYNPEASLKERVCSAISSRAHLKQLNTGGPDFDGYRVAIDLEWNNYWQEVRDLNNLRWDVLSLAYDESAEIPWLIHTDGCSVIRDSSRIEVVAQNSAKDLARSMNLLEAPSMESDMHDSDPRLPDELAVILEAARAFRHSFGHSLQRTCDTVLSTELWQDPSYSVPARIESFYDRCQFSDEIGDGPFDDLVSTLAPIGGLGGLETAAFEAIIDEILHLMSTEESSLVSTKFGLKILMKGAQEMIYLHEQVLLDLLVLVVFVEMDVDREETPIENLDTPKIYTSLLELLKQHQVMQWLAQNIRQEPSKNAEKPNTSKSSLGREPASSDQNRVSTVLENLFAVDPKPQSYTTQSQSAALTHTFQDILQWVVGGNEPSITLDRVLVHIQCNLLVNGNIDLASDFFRYQPSTAWATYVKGRLYLARGEFTEAAIYFKKAAFKLSRPSPSFDYAAASSSLLSPEEATHFNHSLPSYYTHISTLFLSTSRSQTASFAHLALQFLPNPSTPHSSDPRNPLLKTLFHASLATTSYPTAFSALTLLPPTTQPSLLPHLLTSLFIQPMEIQTLLSLPFPPPLIPHIDTFLALKSASAPLLTNTSEKSPAYHTLLSAFRLKNNDHRGAAAALWERLQRILSNRAARAKEGDANIEQSYLAIINLLACAGGDAGGGWVLSGGWDESACDEDDVAAVGTGEERKVVTIGDVRKGWQGELERRSVLVGGRWGFGLDGVGDKEEGEMDVD